MAHVLTAGTSAPGFSLRREWKPTFFINGRRHDGSFAFEELLDAIAAHLTAKAPL